MFDVVQAHIDALPNQDALQALWQQASSVLLHRLRATELLLTDLRQLHAVHLEQAPDRHSLDANLRARAAAKEVLSQVQAGRQAWLGSLTRKLVTDQCP